MTSKRKPVASTDEKDRKSPKPSSYEKPPLINGSTDADAWPNGLASWPSVLLTAGFVALFNRNTYESWQAAVKLIRTAPADIDVDLRLLPNGLLPADQQPNQTAFDRIWMTFWSTDNDITPWKVGTAADDGGPDNGPNERLIVYIFDILRFMHTKSGGSDIESNETITGTFYRRAEDGTFGADLQLAITVNAAYPPPITPQRIRTIQDVRDLTLLTCLTGQYKAVSIGRPSTVLRIVSAGERNRSETVCTDDGFYGALNTTCGYRCCPLFLAIGRNEIVLTIELLKNLPVLELDIYGVYPIRTKSGQDIGWQSPEYWSEDDRFELLIGAARAYMALYRKERAMLLRFLLADCLPYDVFGLIDSYGAQPEIIRRMSKK